jgi:hypothetical protein
VARKTLTDAIDCDFMFIRDKKKVNTVPCRYCEYVVSLFFSSPHS